MAKRRKRKRIYNEKNFVLAALYFVENEATLHEASRENDVPKTSLWRYIHYDLQFVSKKLHKDALEQIKKNRSAKYRREVDKRKETII